MTYWPLPRNLVEARFVERKNRFVALVTLDGREVSVHVPSSGRMGELLVPGAVVYLAPSGVAGRRTAFTLLLVEYGGILVSVDSLLPNRLLYRALQRGELPEFAGYTGVRREFPYREGRMDFLLAGDRGRCLVEVKSVTLVERGEARFPDAPSQRGVRHLEELALARGEGYRAAVVFVVQREDGEYFTPNDGCDPLFGRALRRAYQSGVEVYALGCRVEMHGVTLYGSMPVYL
ncbi:sugar fermentation stimulation protein A [Desulfoscipio geothermicus DSM 3669]|uniref:Sugar fermentation stimulation protein homolog n=1 Tax=Desulfoscipio geothermicus DSM 3669 TaxID=1121426 RepID=A0A1I6E9B1_9FIRM|nr:sugar fermentation stimulation protein A [Desulfoscipio geothermicus DSM 3669]